MIPPLSLECTGDAWGELHEVMAEEAGELIAQLVEDLAAKHLAEMRASWAEC